LVNPQDSVECDRARQWWFEHEGDISRRNSRKSSRLRGPCADLGTARQALREAELGADSCARARRSPSRAEALQSDFVVPLRTMRRRRGAASASGGELTGGRGCVVGGGALIFLAPSLMALLKRLAGGF
jgi:hypothetical protein